MFTGIIQGIAHIRAVTRRTGLDTLTVAFPPAALTGVARGASIALDGCCLTVTEFDADSAQFDVMHETLRITTLGALDVGSTVNFERAAAQGVEVGGHILSGHVDCAATISAIQTPENNRVLTFTLAPEWFRYVFSKGYIAINGTSLTITNANRDRCSFDVWLIPETLRMTTFGGKKVGDRVNIEIERQTQVIVDTVTEFLKTNLVNVTNLRSQPLS